MYLYNNNNKVFFSSSVVLRLFVLDWLAHSLSVGFGKVGTGNETFGLDQTFFMETKNLVPSVPKFPAIEGSKWWRSVKVGGVFTFSCILSIYFV